VSTSHELLNIAQMALANLVVGATAAVAAVAAAIFAGLTLMLQRQRAAAEDESVEPSTRRINEHTIRLVVRYWGGVSHDQIEAEVRSRNQVVRILERDGVPWERDKLNDYVFPAVEKAWLAARIRAQGHAVQHTHLARNVSVDEFRSAEFYLVSRDALERGSVVITLRQVANRRVVYRRRLVVSA
jgi:hypothetical protein